VQHRSDGVDVATVVTPNLLSGPPSPPSSTSRSRTRWERQQPDRHLSQCVPVPGGGHGRTRDLLHLADLRVGRRWRDRDDLRQELRPVGESDDRFHRGAGRERLGDGTLITVVTRPLVGAAPAAPVDVTVITTAGSATLSAAFTYLEGQSPEIYALSPNQGPLEAGHA